MRPQAMRFSMIPLLAAVFLSGAVAVVRGAEATSDHDGKAPLPRLVDLGAGKCIPCRMMKPILDELKREHAHELEVVFIDVWENRKAGAEYGIRVIPTQIFYDASGKERFRHEGFMSKQAILEKWGELGVMLEVAGAQGDKPEA